MTWFGTVSAWGAAAMAVMFAVNGYFQFATGVSGWIYAATALALAVGGFRTLRKMSGGLRLLAGAWGLAAGILLAPLVMGASADTNNPNIYSADIMTDWFVLTLQLLPIAGLALTVLHKETK